MSFKPMIVFGTRPEIIKLSPVIRSFLNHDLEPLIVHTDQHYDEELSDVFLDELNLPSIDYNLDIGSGGHGEQTGKALISLEKNIKKEDPDVIIVQGDTNTVLAGALTASKLHIPVGHVEAGLRSGDMSMPEEINRKLADHVSSFLFTPTDDAKNNLIKEGVNENTIHVVGNTIVDAVLQNSKIANNANLDLDIDKNNYAVLTMHRQENVDHKKNLLKIINFLDNFPIDIVYPIHPRSKKRFNENNLYEKLNSIENLVLTPSLSYLKFLKLMKNSKLILTDSGGIQEEAIILGKPCLTLRENTERPESVEAGGNILTGLEKDKILQNTKKILNEDEFRKSMEQAPNPFGDPGSGERITEILTDHFQ